MPGSPTELGSHGERSFPKSLPATHRRKGGGCWARKSQRPDTGHSQPQGKQGWCWHSLAGIWFPQVWEQQWKNISNVCPKVGFGFCKMAATLSPGAIDLSGDGSSQHWGAALKTWSLTRVCLLWLRGSQGPMLRLPLLLPPSRPHSFWALGSGLSIPYWPFLMLSLAGKQIARVSTGVLISMAAHTGFVYRPTTVFSSQSIGSVCLGPSGSELVLNPCWVTVTHFPGSLSCEGGLVTLTLQAYCEG